MQKYDLVKNTKMERDRMEKNMAESNKEKKGQMIQYSLSNIAFSRTFRNIPIQNQIKLENKPVRHPY